MKSHVIELGCRANATPRLFEIHEMPPRSLPTNHVWITIEPGNFVQHGQSRGIQMDALWSRL